MKNRIAVGIVVGFVSGAVSASFLVARLYGNLMRHEMATVYTAVLSMQEGQLALMRNGEIPEAIVQGERLALHCRSAVSNLNVGKEGTAHATQ